MAITISTKSPLLADILARRETILDDAHEAIANGDAVAAEIATIVTLDDHLRSTRAAAFAILSPQADFAPNVRAARVLPTLIAEDFPTETIVSALHGLGYCMTNASKVAQYRKSAHLLTQGLPLTFDMVRESMGFGHKTASMAVALYDATARVMTLDTWMLNGLLGTANTGGHMNVVGYIAADAAYNQIRDLLLDVADTLDVAPFHLQWSLWNHYRGGFESHLPIFA